MKLTNQQGDVLFYREEKDLASLKRRHAEGDRLVIAEGEATGHAHAIEDIEKCELYEDSDGTLWLRVEEPVAVVHEEHAAQTLSPGTYRVGIVREVDPFTEEIREVAD